MSGSSGNIWACCIMAELGHILLIAGSQEQPVLGGSAKSIAVRFLLVAGRAHTGRSHRWFTRRCGKAGSVYDKGGGSARLELRPVV